ncbi:hypothetical protein BH10BAC3_BH10BAC3_13840 [soil metagenome]
MSKLNEFKASLALTEPPENLSVYLKALWYDSKGDWTTAHEQVDSLNDAAACWVHAYLHRKEGDTWNADYWYRKANKKRPAVSLQDEWEEIVTALL